MPRVILSLFTASKVSRNKECMHVTSIMMVILKIINNKLVHNIMDKDKITVLKITQYSKFIK